MGRINFEISKKTNPLNKIVISIIVSLIKFYQYCISPCFINSCIYKESCSSFAIRVFNKYGFFLGLKLTIQRLLSCYKQ